MRRLAFALILVPVSTALAQPTFTPLGDLPGGQFFSEAYGLSADGETVVGASMISGHILFGGTYAAFAWTEEAGLQNIYSLGGIGTIVRAYGVNADGTLIVGMADYGVLSPTQIVGFTYSTETGLITEIGDLPGGPTGSARAAAIGVSADGSIISGQGESELGTEGFRYTVADSTFLGVGDLAGGIFSSVGWGISADGGTIVGTSAIDFGRVAFRWTQEEGIQSIGHLPVPTGIEPVAEAYAANADGSVIVGLTRTLASSNSGWEAFRWTSSGMVALGDLPGGAVQSVAYATTAEGSIVVGSAGVAGNCSPFGCQTAPRAFIWDAVNGLRDLNVVIAGLGVNLTDWVLTEARGISADGRVIVGTANNPTGGIEAWRFAFGPPPPTCGSADFDGDGDTGTDSDIEAFFACLGGNCCGTCGSADFDADGDTGTDSDIEAFFRVLGGGQC